MKIIAFGIRDDEKPFVDQWCQANPGVEVKITQELLTPETVTQAQGFDGVTALQLNPYADEIFEKLASYGIKNFSVRNVGVDGINPQVVAKLGIKVTNVPVYSPAAIAEFTVTQLLNLLRRTKEYDRKMAQGDFRWAPQISRELNQQVIGVVGTGHIGRVAIQIYQGFGAKVIAYDAFRNPELEKTGIYVDSLDELYAQATVVTLHVPLLDSTYHMLDQAAFAKMRPGTLIVNASRGPLIDEEALIAALDSGQIAGAALDVMEDETQVFNHDLGNRKPDYPAFNNLFARDNVLISPHRAFYTDVAVRNMVFESFQASRDLFEKGYSDKEVKF